MADQGFPRRERHPIITVRNEVAKVMFLQVCVCPQGGLLQGGAWSWGVSALGGGLLPGGAWSWGDVCSRGIGIPACTEADTPRPPGEMATAADGTHPTGMHSCFGHFFP